MKRKIQHNGATCVNCLATRRTILLDRPDVLGMVTSIPKRIVTQTTNAVSSAMVLTNQQRANALLKLPPNRIELGRRKNLIFSVSRSDQSETHPLERTISSTSLVSSDL